ncbi:MAG: hypothetical protein A2Z98_12490 [Spirochaetes bacterium GWB1_27_13]|nr:MAG: hypothetical protein A2Z98_12490 [Spirochaetes bacterium GWB1_27_13]
MKKTNILKFLTNEEKDILRELFLRKRIYIPEDTCKAFEKYQITKKDAKVFLQELESESKSKSQNK